MRERVARFKFAGHRCPLTSFRLEDPEWRPMREPDWRELHLDPVALHRQ